MPHPNALVLEKIYGHFAEANIPAFQALCDDKITFQLAGKSPLAGKFTKSTFASEFLPRLYELTGGTLKLEVHDILASDRHGVVLASDHFTRHGKPHQVRTVHVWRFEDGRPVAWYLYPRDLYQWDDLLGSDS